MSRREGDPRHCTGTGTVPVVHEHGWCVESRHATSIGYVLYVRCAGCGARRVDLQERPESPPEALSSELRPLGRPS